MESELPTRLLKHTHPLPYNCLSPVQEGREGSERFRGAGGRTTAMVVKSGGQFGVRMAL